MLSFAPEGWGHSFMPVLVVLLIFETDQTRSNTRARLTTPPSCCAPQLEHHITIDGGTRHVLGTVAGAIDLIPANNELLAEWRFPIESIFVALAPEHMSQLATAEYGEPGRFCPYCSAHLLRRYTNAPKNIPRSKRGGLEAQNMRRVEDFLRANLRERLTSTSLPWWRVFRRRTSPEHFGRRLEDTPSARHDSAATTLISG